MSSTQYTIERTQQTPFTEAETEAQMSPMIEPKPLKDLGGKLKVTPSWPLISVWEELRSRDSLS